MNDFVRTLLPLAAFAAACAAVLARIAGPEAFLPGLAAGFAAGVALLLGSGPLVLALYRARPADETSAPALVRTMRELSGRAGLPAPRVWLIEDAAPSAFATGLLRSRSTVAVTTGLVALLSERELRAVLAHELAHIRRRDTCATSLSVALAGVLPLLALAAFAAFALFAPGSPEPEDLQPIQVWLLAALAPVAAAFVVLVLDRAREFEADRWAAALCGDPAALAEALSKIEAAGLDAPPPRGALRHPRTQALLIVPPQADAASRPWTRWFASQPSAEGRIERLRELAAAPGSPGGPRAQV